MPTEWRTTYNQKPFLIYDNGPAKDTQRILIFASEEGLLHLAQSRRWYVDGTFSVVPIIFDQLYVIRAPLGDSSVSCVYALLPGRTQLLYEEMFRAIQNVCEMIDISPDPAVVIADFEKAVWQAVTVVFGDHVEVKGCFFHLTQSTWRKIQSLGLTTAYKDEDEAKQFCGMLDALAFLPVSDIPEAIEYLRQNVPDGFDDLFSYFDSTYVSGSCRLIRCLPSARQPSTQRIRIRRLPPQFPPPTWNVFDATLASGPRTNNETEAWNRAFAQQIGHSHPSIYTLIDNMRKDNALVIAALEAESRGQPPKKRVKRASRDLQERLSNLCTARRDGTKTVIEVLKALGHTIRFS